MAKNDDKETIARLREENRRLKARLAKARGKAAAGGAGSLREAEERLRLAFAATEDAVWDVDLAGGSIRWNEAYERAFGRPPEKGIWPWWEERVHPQDLSRVRASLKAAIEGPGDTWTAEYAFRGAEGQWVEILDRARIARDGSGRAVRIVGVAQDLSDRKRVEEALRQAHEDLERKVQERTVELRAAVDQLQAEVRQRLAAETEVKAINVVLRMVGEVNEALVRANDEATLIQDICRIAVEMGGYRMAWVGFAENDAGRVVRPVASVGFENGYLTRAGITWADTVRGRGPTGTAIRTGRPQVGRNFLTDPELAPWRAGAIRSGFQSSVSLPLAQGGEVFGALTIYAAQTGTFDESRVAILQEMADNLAFGIMALRTRKALELRSQQLRAMTSRLTLAEERERQRIARVLHDHLQQLLVAARFWIGGLARSRAKGVRESAAEIGTLVDQSLQASRTLTAELSPPALQESGLAAGLEWLGQWMQEKHGLAVELRTEGEAGSLPEDVTIVLYQSVRELLLNVAKHAEAKAAAVSLAVTEGQVCVLVQDEGVGFDPEQGPVPGRAGGFGLFGIRERVEMLGGRLEVDSAPGQGSRFLMSIPLASPGTGGAEPG